MNRAAFLRLLLGGLAGAVLAPPLRALAANADYDFWLTRLKYDSGDWDVDQRMPANVITSLIDYTNLRVDPKERVIALSDPRMLDAPFCYLAGHKLVEFNPMERRNFERYVRNGGFVFVDDCNHDIDGLFARSFEAQMAAIFGANLTLGSISMASYALDAPPAPVTSEGAGPAAPLPDPSTVPPTETNT